MGTLFTKMKPDGIILVGGRSRRFGQDKALFVMPGQTQTNVELMVAKLQPFTNRIWLAANSTNGPKLQTLFQQNPQIKVCLDPAAYPDYGPLAGLYAVTAKQPQRQDYLMVATDYPYLTTTLLKKLAQQPQSFIQTPEHTHYTLAHFTTTHAPLAKLLKQRQHHLKAFIVASAGCQPLQVPTSPALRNLNYRQSL
uniref:Molybdopterin-guanine dinucleotide biosynthesis protein MobA n=1 Tax=Loigolactobacillus rennini TaxID=238013 RepID=A0A1K2I3P2_9LACO|nr:Molybdopterin-guanine dinucleotide biosynthesis protein MobA [Loigolactobacillus rennini]